jgi:hypothetical protein
MVKMTDIELNVIDQTNILRIKSAFSKEECAEVCKEILAYKDNPSDNDVTNNVNDGCWLGHPHLYGGYSYKVEQLLLSKFKLASSAYFNSMPQPANLIHNTYPNVNANDWEIWAWANVNDHGSENREHTHSNSFISAVAYFQAEGTGRLEFMPYNYVYKSMLPQWPYHGTSWYEPQDGDIILFPSYLLHKLERNPSNKQRINMAFNAKPPPPKGGQHNAGY